VKLGFIVHKGDILVVKNNRLHSVYPFPYSQYIQFGKYFFVPMELQYKVIDPVKKEEKVISAGFVGHEIKKFFYYAGNYFLVEKNLIRCFDKDKLEERVSLTFSRYSRYRGSLYILGVYAGTPGIYRIKNDTFERLQEGEIKGKYLLKDTKKFTITGREVPWKKS
jgi:hypothetical protein